VGEGSSVVSAYSSVTSMVMFLVAAGAAGVAIAAVMMGRRQKPIQTHPLQGAMTRRIALFNEFGNRPAPSGGRPERLVEMTTSGDNGGEYTLA